MFKFISATAMLLLSVGALAQTFTISGTVRNQQNNYGLPGATVQLEEINRATVTDDFGVFTLRNVPPGDYTLQISFVGFETKSQKLNVVENTTLDIVLDESARLTEEVVVSATRANAETPTAFTNVSKQTLEKHNFGQDLPFLLNWTPSLVTTSDAGAGVGYTGLRIRGSDATRINVTINGIPYNDSESQGTFWVNIPDIASSTESIQVQRGVGTSTNGAGSFGGSVNLQTVSLQRKAYGEVNGSFGSFNTRRLSIKGGTGLIKDHWAFDARLSKITSDGYIDRATSDLQSFYFSGGYHTDKTIVKAVVFGGGEKTYQSWNGVDEATLKTDRTFNSAGAIYDENWNITGFYGNEVDDYKQDHYQLHVSQELTKSLVANISLHYTYGRGFFEQYKSNEPFAELGLDNFQLDGNTIESGDVIVRRWLDNDFYGTTFSLNYDKDDFSLTFGGAYNEYTNARHFGQIIWAEYDQNVTTPYQYYNGESDKQDFNVYSKLNYKLTEKLLAFADLQYRAVAYKTAGIDDNQNAYDFEDDFDFFNPKAGLSYQLTKNNILFASYAVANREPNRTDYVDGTVIPKSERLQDFELGWRSTSSNMQLEANFYYMNYSNQLVLTGSLDDVGNPIRANVGESYRSGVELSSGFRPVKNVTWNLNLTLSRNTNKDFVVDETTLAKENTEIILSPSIIGGSQLSWRLKGFEATLLSKYIGDQYLDNTENSNLKLDAYFINDVRLNYTLAFGAVKGLDLGILLNNIFDVEYSSNGYSYGETAYYFPQAGRNLMIMLGVKL